MARAEPAWSTQDWAWDPVSLSAAPKAAPEQASARDAAMLMAAISPAAAPALGGLLSQALASQAQEHSTAKKPHRPTCQVPGCNADLQGSRAYYRRYRICEAHFRLTSFNMPSILNGVTCRFCQQVRTHAQQASTYSLTHIDSQLRPRAAQSTARRSSLRTLCILLPMARLMSDASQCRRVLMAMRVCFAVRQI